MTNNKNTKEKHSPKFPRRGEVYLVDLPYDVGSVQVGKRPAVIIQNDVGNRFSNTTIVAPLTTKVGKTKKVPTHLEVKDEQSGRESIVLLEQPKAIDKQRIDQYIFTLTEEQLKQLDVMLKISLGIK